jgi:hypothetical protein
MPTKKGQSSEKAPPTAAVAETVAATFEDIAPGGAATPSASEPVSAGTAENRPAATAEGEALTTPRYAPEADAKITVSLSNYKGGPRVHLLRSSRFKHYGEPTVMRT